MKKTLLVSMSLCLVCVVKCPEAAPWEDGETFRKRQQREQNDPAIRQRLEEEERLREQDSDDFAADILNQGGALHVPAQPDWPARSVVSSEQVKKNVHLDLGTPVSHLTPASSASSFDEGSLGYSKSDSDMSGVFEHSDDQNTQTAAQPDGDIKLVHNSMAQQPKVSADVQQPVKPLTATSSDLAQKMFGSGLVQRTLREQQALDSAQQVLDMAQQDWSWRPDLKDTSASKQQARLELLQEYLDHGGNPDLKNAAGKTLLSLLLDNVRFKSMKVGDPDFAVHVRNTLALTKLLLDHGAQPTREDINDSLRLYRNFLNTSPLESQAPTLDPEPQAPVKTGFWNRVLSRFVSSRRSRVVMTAAREVASSLAQNVFMLDQAAAKNVVSEEQREQITALENEYKTPWQKAVSWWQRVKKNWWS